MIVYVGFAQRDEWTDWAGAYARHAARFEAASGETPCLVVPFEQASVDLIDRLQPSSVVFSGFARSFQDYEVASFAPVARLIRERTSLPMLLLCGAHQLAGFLFSGELDGAERLYDQPMRRRRADEPAANPDYHPEFFMERGFYPLTRHGADPLFAGCADPPWVYESHYCEIKELPPGFRLLASTPECRIQAMRHATQLLVGCQFHPEDYSDAFPDGRTILANFFAEAREARP